MSGFKSLRPKISTVRSRSNPLNPEEIHQRAVNSVIDALNEGHGMRRATLRYRVGRTSLLRIGSELTGLSDCEYWGKIVAAWNAMPAEKKKQKV